MSGRHRSGRLLDGGVLSVVAGVGAVIALILATVFAATAGRGSDRPPQPGADAAGTLAIPSPVATDLSEASSVPAPSVPTSAAAPPSATASPSTIIQPSASAPQARTSSAPTPRTTSSTAPSRSSATHRTSAPSTTSVPSTITAPTKPAPPRRSVAVTGPVLPASAPTALILPSIGVGATAIVDLGLQDDGTLETPSLADPNSRPGWYTGSPAPGVAGPAIILGHVDSARYGPGVFYSIGAMRPGDPVEVRRADGSVAVFTVDAVRSYAKKDFPTLTVYGNTDTASLRLITCGGIFDPAARSYDRNTVVFAHLTGSRTA